MNCNTKKNSVSVQPNKQLHVKWKTQKLTLFFPPKTKHNKNDWHSIYGNDTNNNYNNNDNNNQTTFLYI